VVDAYAGTAGHRQTKGVAVSDEEGFDQPGVTIRRLSPRDWRLVMRLRLAALRDSPDAFLGDLAQEECRTPAQWQNVTTQNDWFAALCGGRPSGVVCAVRDPPSGEMYVECMWVDSAHRGRGVAGQLLREIESLALAENRSQILLWVLEGHDDAAAVYRRYGFAETGRYQPAPAQAMIIEHQFRLTLCSPQRCTAHDSGAKPTTSASESVYSTMRGTLIGSESLAVTSERSTSTSTC
jgi:GNAT superfamily N-acetyltransferase